MMTDMSSISRRYFSDFDDPDVINTGWCYPGVENMKIKWDYRTQLAAKLTLCEHRCS